jgi:diguanylate cyclase (GGDEF)-like protein
MPAALQDDQAVVQLFKTACEARRRQDLDAVASVIHELRTKRAALSALAPFYAELLDARKALFADDVGTAARHLAAARDHFASMPATAHAQVALAESEARFHIATMTPADALSSLERAWALRDEVDDPQLCEACAVTIWLCFCRLERWADGAPWIDAGIDLARHHGRRLQAFGLRIDANGACWDEGDQLARRGLVEQARARWDTAAATYEDLMSDPCVEELTAHRLTCILGDYAACLTRVGRSAEALPIIERSFTAFKSFTSSADLLDADLQVTLCLARATILRDLQRLDEAETEAGIALGLAQQHKVTRHLCDAFLLLSSIAERQDDLAAALRHLRSFIQTREEFAFQEAQLRSATAAVKFQTQRALGDAKQAHEHAARMEQEAQVDGLTGLANRRRFDRHLATAHEEARLRHMPLCVAILDVDHFKNVNDTHGHGVGDAVLRRLGALLAEQCRGEDLVARIGGEEFAVVFSGIGLRRAQEVCERIRAAIAAGPWADIAPALTVTISVGVADIEADESASEGLATVDRLLYDAKRSGRNRVVSSQLM